MRKEEVIKQFTTPLDAGAFPLGPYRFYNREYLNILYRTDLERLRKIVPEPLEVTSPLVRFEIMKMPDVTGLGSYTECGQVIPVNFEGEEGDYLHAMYVDSFPAIASGREIGAYPKKMGKPSLYVDSDTLVGLMDYGSLRVATATMGYKHFPLDHSEALQEIVKPNYMLKKMPDYDGYPRICELVRSQITDIKIQGAWSGPARLELFAHALAPMADLPVLEVVSASHIITELSLPSPTVIYDYLADEK
ncbi:MULTISPECIES: acetoacetate decarboxylase [unclassified Paenibacillus]|uniref:acetoacetate decarboxylase n=1 Tax=unclassified Paenibacillus TaxID=185978 RepID=UPI0009A79ABB|nr:MULTISPECIES: acetoacetate decarboxylase [unclassified Paenibacillus]SLJ89099.1 acetoacetate decarboxylase [Paenibacillus sp. RU5A]SOC59842.1 acetoacetate decarboxylase [Paenibacillus sp. RU26A]SOC68359.1 acetoacetate decarboxylase [Paenibacillus sp. RU5M]